MARTEGRCVHGYPTAQVAAEVTQDSWYSTKGFVVEIAPDCKLCDGEIAGVPYKPGPPQVQAGSQVVS